jgi:hypothetical protein
MPSTAIFAPNDILVDQTMICEASHILNPPAHTGRSSEQSVYVLGAFDKEAPNVERLLHLSMLLDALALHEHLYVLKAELPADWQSLRLRRTLIDQGIVRELDAIPYLNQISQDFSGFFTKFFEGLFISPPGFFRPRESAAGFRRRVAHNAHAREWVEKKRRLAKDVVSAVEAFLAGKRWASVPEEPELTDIYFMAQFLAREQEGRGYTYRESKFKSRSYLYGVSDSRQEELLSSPLPTLAAEMLESLAEFSSGSGARGVSLLRTFVYWRISEHARISFYPSCRRTPQIDLFTDHLRQAMAQKVYKRVAKAFKENIETVFADEAQLPLFLPPTVTIFLDFYQSTNNLGEALELFRNEFAPLRKRLQIWENEILEAKTLRERLKVKENISRSLKALEARYVLRSDSALESVVSFAPEVLKPLANPWDPSQYSKELLAKPLNWIRTWWNSRPLRQVFRLRKRLQNIVEYENLANRVLGIEFNQQEREEFLKHYTKYLDIFGRDTTSAVDTPTNKSQ